MSGISKTERDAYQAMIAAHLAEKGATKCQPHASSTGAMRFNYARKAAREAKEREEAEQMEQVRSTWQVENGFVQEAQNDARGYHGE